MTNTGFFRPAACTGLSLALAAFATSAAAQDVSAAQSSDNTASGIADIVVTAQKRESTLQKTPIAITALDGAELSQQGKTTLEDALREVAGVTVQTENNGATYTIRGIRPATQTDPAVNVNRDGVFQSNDGITPNFDVARIEVLKGPQGTLYGRNAVGGVVNIVNTDPKFENSGFASILFGNEHAARAEGAVNIALSDKLASRTAAYYNMHDGYLSDGNDDDNSLGVRQKFLFQPNTALSLSVTGEYDHTDANGRGTVFAPLSAHPGRNPYYSALQTGRTLNDKYAVYGSLNYDFGPVVLSFIPSYYRVKLHVDSDLQGQGLQAALLNGRQATQELRLSAPSSSQINWQIGAYHLNYQQTLNQFATPITTGERPLLLSSFPPFLLDYDVPDSSVDSLAGFAQTTVPLFSGFRATGGIRYTRDIKKLTTDTFNKLDGSFVSTTPEQRVRQSAVTWKAGIEYDVAPRSLFYADVSKGFKSGGLNQLGSPAGYETYAPEKLMAYEVGLKNRLFDNRLQLNVDGFYYDYSSKQFQAVQPQAFGFPILVTFSGAAKVYGGEAQVDWQITGADRLSGALAYTHTRITKFDYSGFPSQVGQGLENTPLWSGNAGYDHVFAIGSTGELTAGAAVTFQTGTDVVTDIVVDDYQRAFAKLDLSLRYHNRAGGFTLALFGNNVTNRATRSRGFPRPTGVDADTLTLDPPRTYGVSFRKEF